MGCLAILSAPRAILASGQEVICIRSSLWLSSIVRGGHVEPDLREAYIWYRRAAELGDARAQFIVGRLSATGAGVAANLRELARWFLQSAKKGDPLAAITLRAFTHEVRVSRGTLPPPPSGSRSRPRTGSLPARSHSRIACYAETALRMTQSWHGYGSRRPSKPAIMRPRFRSLRFTSSDSPFHKRSTEPKDCFGRLP